MTRQAGQVTLGQVREKAVKMSGNQVRDVRLIDPRRKTRKGRCEGSTARGNEGSESERRENECHNKGKTYKGGEAGVHLNHT